MREKQLAGFEEVVISSRKSDSGLRYESSELASHFRKRSSKRGQME
jgi:hypothetical protein